MLLWLEKLSEKEMPMWQVEGKPACLEEYKPKGLGGTLTESAALRELVPSR